MRAAMLTLLFVVGFVGCEQATVDRRISRPSDDDHGIPGFLQSKEQDVDVARDIEIEISDTKFTFPKGVSDKNFRIRISIRKTPPELSANDLAVIGTPESDVVLIEAFDPETNTVLSSDQLLDDFRFEQTFATDSDPKSIGLVIVTDPDSEQQRKMLLLNDSLDVSETGLRLTQSAIRIAASLKVTSAYLWLATYTDESTKSFEVQTSAEIKSKGGSTPKVTSTATTSEVVSSVTGDTSGQSSSINHDGFPLWTWVGGSQLENESPVYGTKGLAASSNTPGQRVAMGRQQPVDSSNNLWMFGGDSSPYVFRNDLWKFDGTNWTWISGSNLGNDAGVYTQHGVASDAIYPSARREHCIAYNSSSNSIWIFGGRSTTNLPLKDLWKYDIATNKWTWMSGPEVDDGNNAAFGVKGQTSADAHPNARIDPICWFDSSGEFWMYGGAYALNAEGMYRDIWKFDGTNWGWMGGAYTPTDDTNQTSYGEIGVASEDNRPAFRTSSPAGFSDDVGLIFFGGSTRIGYSDFKDYDDFWRLKDLEFTWLGGHHYTIVNAAGSYGDLKVSANSNYPRARESGMLWVDGFGDIYLFGGSIRGVTGNDVYARSQLDDLWRYRDGKWVWISGSNLTDGANGNRIYGQKGVPSSDNTPGARHQAAYWVDHNNTFYMYGGRGWGLSGNYQLSDMWKLSFEE